MPWQFWLNHAVGSRQRFRGVPPNAARNAPVMHGFCCRCQQRQRRPEVAYNVMGFQDSRGSDVAAVTRPSTATKLSLPSRLGRGHVRTQPEDEFGASRPDSTNACPVDLKALPVALRRKDHGASHPALLGLAAIPALLVSLAVGEHRSA